MTALRDTAADYLTIRRALGFKLREHEWALASFVSFLEHAGASTISTALALQWASDTRGAATATRCDCCSNSRQTRPASRHRGSTSPISTCG